MDEGIKLLLERRKMYPEEFMRRRDRFYSKWVDFLELWSIDLDDASTYVNVRLFGDGEFHKAVMRKLLEEEEKDLSFLDMLGEAMVNTKERMAEYMLKRIYPNE